jgi:hypothetical protein
MATTETDASFRALRSTAATAANPLDTMLAQSWQRQPAAPTTPQPPANQAVTSVRENLQAVDNGTIGAIEDVQATVIDLPQAARNTLVSELSDQSLQSWMNATNKFTNPDDQQAVFDALALGLDNRQLARVINAFGRDNAISSDNVAILGRFGDAVANNKSATELKQFVQSAAGAVERDQKAALVVAKVLGALGEQSAPSTYSGGVPYTPTNSFEPALASLNDAQLNSVVDAAMQERFAGNARVYDPKALVTMLDAAAAVPMGNRQKDRLIDAGLNTMQRLAVRPDEGPKPGEVNAKVAASMGRLIDSEQDASIERRAAIFEKTANAWGGFSGSDQAVDKTIATSLNDLLTTDTNGVMAELETQFREGTGLTRFVSEMIAQGRAEEDLKPIVAQLKLGNELDGDPIKRFEAKDSQGDFRNAQTLGYFVGTVYSGVSNLNAGRDADADALSDIFNLASIVTGLGGKAVDLGKFAVTKALDQHIDDYKRENLELRDTISMLAYPTDANGRRYEGAKAETVYDTAVGRIKDNLG